MVSKGSAHLASQLNFLITPNYLIIVLLVIFPHGMLVFAAWESLSCEAKDPFKAESAAHELTGMGSREEKIRIESLRLEKSSKVMESNIWPNNIVSTKP